MARFTFVAVTASGQRINGEMVAKSRTVVADVLQREGKYLVHAEEIGHGQRAFATSGRRPPSIGQMTVFTRELAMLLTAGLPLAQALATVRIDTRSKALAGVIKELEAALDEGSSFHDAVRRQPRAFPRSFASMIRVGEASGTLAPVVERLAEALEHEQRLRSKLLSTLLYPCFLILTAIAAVCIMLLFVVPRFKVMIGPAHVNLSSGANFAIAVSDWLVAHGQKLAVGLAVAMAALAFALRRARVRRWLDKVLLGLPVIGNLMRLRMATDFCRGIGTLLVAGVDLAQALSITRENFANRQLGLVIAASYDSLRKGQNFCEPLTMSGLLPPVATSMLRVGQETGDLGASALRVARMMEEKLEVATTRLLTILEPAIIVLVSLFVAGVIISIIGAIVSVNELVLG